MHWKTTAVLLLATLGIGTYVSLYELKQPDPERREALAKQIVDLSPDEITQVVVDLPEAKFTVTKDAGVWRMPPNGLRASQDELATLFDQLNPLNSERTLSATAEHPLDLKAFGLDPAVGRLSVTAKGQTTTVNVGEPTAVGGHRYVQVAGQPEVHTITGALFDAANQPADHFRDLRLIPVDLAAANHVSAKTPQNAFVVNRTDHNVWWLNEPVSDRAERDQVYVFLTTLSGIKTARVLDDPVTPEALPAWGLDQPMTAVTVRVQGGPPQGITASFGKPLPDDATLVYAMRSDESLLYAVAAADVASLARDPHGLRQLACFNFFPSDATKVQLDLEGKLAWTLEKTEEVWRVAGSPEPLDAVFVDELIKQIAHLRIGGFVEEQPTDLAKYGLNPPAAAVTVWIADQQTPQRLLVGNPVEGSPASRYGRIEGRETVVRLPEIAELLKTTPESLRPPVPGPTSTEAGATPTPTPPAAPSSDPAPQ